MRFGRRFGVTPNAHSAGGFPAVTGIVISDNEVYEDDTIGTGVGTLIALGGTAPFVWTVSGNTDFTNTGALVETAASLVGQVGSENIDVHVIDVNGKEFNSVVSIDILAAAVPDDPGIGDGGGVVDDGGFEEIPIVESTTGGLKITGKKKSGGIAKMMYPDPAGVPVAGSVIVAKVTGDYTNLNKAGRSVLLGLAFKANDEYFIIGLKGDGGNPTTVMRVHEIHATDWQNRTQGTQTDHGVALNGTRLGPNWHRLDINPDGTTVDYFTSSDGIDWNLEEPNLDLGPFANVSEALQFGLVAWIPVDENGVIGATINNWDVSPPITNINYTLNEIFQSASIGTKITTFSVTGGKEPITYSEVSDPSGLAAINGVDLEVAASLTGVTSFDYIVRATDLYGRTFDELLDDIPVSEILLPAFRVFTTADNATTYTPTEGTTKCLVYCTGSGGGGGSLNLNSSASLGVSGAGSSGGTTIKLFDVADISGQTMTIPSGGAGGTASAESGGNGSACSIGALISANGGLGGLGRVGADLVAIPKAGAAATSVSGALNLGGSASGGGANTSEAGASASAAGARGASSYWGGGGKPGFVSATGSDAGSAASVPGAGGAGAAAWNTTGVFAGGAGGPAVIVIKEFA